MERDRMGKCDTRQGQFRQHVQAEYIPACASGLLSYDHEYAMLNTLTGTIRVGMGHVELSCLVLGALQHNPGRCLCVD